MALLTPYSAQRDMIRHYAEKANLLKEGASSCIQVASVTESQGYSTLDVHVRSWSQKHLDNKVLKPCHVSGVETTELNISETVIVCI